MAMDVRSALIWAAVAVALRVLHRKRLVAAAVLVLLADGDGLEEPDEDEPKPKRTLLVYERPDYITSV